MKGLLESRKAIFSMLLVVAVSVLAILRILTVEQWIDYTKWLSGFYVGAEAVDSGLGKLGVYLSGKKEETVTTPDAMVEQVKNNIIKKKKNG